MLYGVGVLDATYKVTVYQRVGGKLKQVWLCPYYRRWKGMLERGYSETYKKKYPSYEGCTVCDEWLTFTNFKFWMEKQKWEGKDLDKDLLGDGGVYSPSTCIFIPQRINKFLTNGKKARKLNTIGVTLVRGGKYAASCHDPFTGKYVWLGQRSTEEEAGLLWREKKYEMALKLAEEIDNPIAREVFINKYKI